MPRKCKVSGEMFANIVAPDYLTYLSSCATANDLEVNRLTKFNEFPKCYRIEHLLKKIPIAVETRHAGSRGAVGAAAPPVFWSGVLAYTNAPPDFFIDLIDLLKL
jgi:hypothetical protein